MIDLYEELSKIAVALESAGLKYALVGGIAVSLYTRPRATRDGLRQLKRLRRSAQDEADLAALEDQDGES